MLRSATAQMLPPCPPSPPSGPPRGTYFSRRKDAAPLPPSPAITSMTASSMNFIARFRSRDPQRSLQWASRLFIPDVEDVALGRVPAPSALPFDPPARERGRRPFDGAVLNEKRAAVRHVV